MRLADEYKSTIWTTEKDQNILTEPAVQGKLFLVKNKQNQKTKYGKIPQQVEANECTTAVTKNIYTILSVIWLAGTVITSVCLLVTNIRFYLLLKNNRKEMPNKKDCSIQIYESTVVNGPCLFGLFHPAIYLPAGFNHSDISMEHIIAHEYMHYRHRDYLWAVFRGICLAVYWFDPLVWMAAFVSIQDGELACDEAAISYLGEGKRRDYGRTLICMEAYCGEKRMFLSCATHAKGRKTEIKERIVMIVKRPKTKLITGMILLLAVILLSGTAFSHARSNKETPNHNSGRYGKQAGEAKEAVIDATQEKEDAWEYPLKEEESGYLMEVTAIQHKDGKIVLNGTSYADTIVIFTSKEKKRLDQGETVLLTYSGGSYTLSKLDQENTENGCKLTSGENSVDMKLVKGQYMGKDGWILCDRISGMEWKPTLKEKDTLTLDADALIEVNNYYAYYDCFSDVFTINVQDSLRESAAGSHWTIKQYDEQYLKNIIKLKKHGGWMGNTLARICVKERNGSISLKDCYMP